MHATCAELLAPALRPGAVVLDAGSGSGFFCALLAQLVVPSGTVIGVELQPHLVAQSNAVLDADPAVAAARGQGVTVAVHEGDAHRGVPACAPFDAIHVGAAAARLPPALVAQLKPGGRLVIPLGPDGGDQVLWRVDVGAGGEVESTPLMGVRYVPLVDTQGPL